MPMVAVLWRHNRGPVIAFSSTVPATTPLSRRTSLQALALGAASAFGGANGWALEGAPGFLVQSLAGTAAQTWRWRDLQGQTWEAPALRGRAVLLNFWASWCAPCREEMPTLHALQQQLGAARAQVLLLNYRESLARVASFVAQSQWTLPVIADPEGAVARHWGVRIFPSSVLIDAHGQPVARVVGAVDWGAQREAPWMQRWLA